MSKIILVFNIIVPVLICLILVFLFQTLDYFKYNSFYFTISLFGIIIILFNLKKIRYNIIISLVSSVSLSFIVLFLSLFAEGGTIYLFEKLLIVLNLDDMSLIGIKERQYILSVTLLSPILMFYSYRLLFQIKKNTYFKIVVVISILALFILRLTKIIKEEIYLFIYWQFIMALALQLILYQK